MAVDTQKFLPPAKTTGAIIKSSPAMSAAKQKKTLGVIKVKVIDITKILKGSVATDKNILKDTKRQDSEDRKAEQEENLEAQVKDKSGKIPTPKRLPRMSFLDSIKNFIKNIIFGYLAVRLIDHLPKLIPLVNAVARVGDFLIDSGIKLVDTFASFVNFGYKAYDKTRGIAKSIGGEPFAKNFDKFMSGVDTALFLTTVLAGEIALEALTGGDDGGGLGDIVGDQLKKRIFQKAAGQVAGQAGRTAGMGAGAIAAVVAGAGLLASALGEGAFQLRKISAKPIQDATKAFNNEKNPIVKFARGALLGGMYTLLGPLSVAGTLLDIIGAPFRYAIELIRFPFLSEEDKKKQKTNLAKFDARIREDFRKALNIVSFGTAFKKKGQFGNIYGDAGAQKDMMSKMAGGGRPVTRGGKTVGGARRTIGGKKTKQKYNRILAQKPKEVEFSSPGKDIGGEDKIFGIFPNPFADKDKKKRVKEGPLQKVGKDLGKTDYVGPLLAIATKITLGQKPSTQDYDSAALGINMLLAKGVSEGEIQGTLVSAFANGGMVNKDFLSTTERGVDITSWVAKTFRGEIETNAQKTMRLIREAKEAGRKTTTTRTAPPTTTTPRATTTAQKIIIAYGTNDWGLSEAQIEERTKKIIQAATSKGYGVVMVIPNKDLKVNGQSKPGPHNAVLKASTELGVTTEMGKYDVSDSLHLTTAEAQRIKNAYPGAEIIGDSNAVRIAGGGDVAGKRSVGVTGQDVQGYADNLSQAQQTPTSGVIPSPDSLGPVGKVGKIYLHWSAGEYDKSYPRKYHSTILGDGSKVQTVPYKQFRTPEGHTAYRNSMGVGIAVAAMAGPEGNYKWPKPIQIEKMTDEAAFLAKKWGWTPGMVTVRNVATHAEVGSMKDGVRNSPALYKLGAKKDPDNHGPAAWGGDGARWDLFQLTKGGVPGSGGDILRSKIKAKMAAFHGRFIPKTGPILAHEGEYVIDKDSVNLVGRDFFEVFNKIETASQMKQKAGFLISRLAAYTDDFYGSYGEEFISIPIPVPVPMPTNSPSMTVLPSPSGSSDNSMKEFAYQNS